MSTDRDDLSDRDEVVSAAYRELSEETTPGHLDAAILALAKERAGTPDRGRVRWTQPVAWAAMIVVTLAILLQVAELPEPPPPGLVIPAGPAASDAAPEPGSAPPAEPAPGPAADAAPAAAPSRRQERAVPATAERTEADAPAAQRTDDTFGDVDATMIREAEQRAREQTGSSVAKDAPLRPAVSATAFEAARPGPACDEDARSSPGRWLECIEELREAGDVAAAERELAELRAAHPGLELP